MLEFKTKRQQKEWTTVHPNLIPIMEDLEARWYEPATITSVYRPPEEEATLNPAMMGAGGTSKSPHSTKPPRAADVRTRNIRRDVVESAVMALNAKWIYDPSRPTMKVAKFESEKAHVHLQCHASTTLRSNYAEYI